jgi:hypothetical protein
MRLSLSQFHHIAILAVLANSPFAGCDDHESVFPSSPISNPEPEPEGPPPGSSLPNPPSGGTPEPATMLLVAGSAAAYVAVRRRRQATSGDHTSTER